MAQRRLCFICKGPETSDRSLCQDGFHKDLWFHLNPCLNGEAAKAWREHQRQIDPVFRRYCKFMGMGLEVECPNCQSAQRVFPKAVGMAAGSWQLNCTSCYRLCHKTFEIGPPRWAAYEALERLRGDFVYGRHLASIESAVTEIAQRFDRNFAQYICKCGGHFSIAARPRCAACSAVILDSFFHCTTLYRPPAKPQTAPPH